MNDEFLTQFREAPRHEFANALYERISQQPQPRLDQVKRLTFRKSIIVFVLLFLIAIPVYAAVERHWNKVGDIWVDVQSMQKFPFIISGLYKGTVGDMEVANLKEAQAALKFEFAFPTWVPKGFVLDDHMNISPWSEKTLSASWKSQDGGAPIGIFLNYRWFWVATSQFPMLESVSTGPVAPDAFEKVRVQGRPAVLVRGDWDWNMQAVGEETTDIDVNWDKQKGVSLYWTDGDVAYLLWTYNRSVSAEDLIKMAESAHAVKVDAETSCRKMTDYDCR